MHDKLGMQVIPLRLLTPYESKLFTLDLVRSMNPNDPQNKKNRGKLIVELTFDPFREDNMSSDGEGNASVRREADGECSGGVLLVSVENAEDVEGKRHTNPYAEVLFRGERKKTKVTLLNYYYFLCSNAQALFSSRQKPKTFQNSPSHRILRHMHKALNIVEN